MCKLFSLICTPLHAFCCCSGSQLLFTALSCLLQITYVIAQDSAPENAQLLQYLQAQRVPVATAAMDSTHSDTASSISKDLFAGLLARAQLSSSFASTAPAAENALTTSTTGTSNSTTIRSAEAAVAVPAAVKATDRALAEGFRSVQEYVQWRVQLLQRIQLPLAVAYR